jgi:hypothetical protein
MKRSTLIARWYSWTPGHWLLGILVSIVLGSVPIGPASALGPAATNFPGKITLQDGQLAAKIATVPLRQVLEEFSRLSGVQVRWLSPADEEEAISVEFPPLPIAEALRRILCEKNFLLFYITVRGEPRLTQVWISSRGKAGGQPALTPQPVTAGEATPRAEELDVNIAQSLEVVIQTALSDEDLASRLSAIEYLGNMPRKTRG